jgi:hypothetical protein
MHLIALDAGRFKAFKACCVLLAGVRFLQCSEEWFMGVHVCAIHIQVIFSKLVYMVFFLCVFYTKNKVVYKEGPNKVHQNYRRN